MPNQPTPSQSQSQSQNTLNSKSNGLEDETDYSPKKYTLEDFSQQAINRGQVEINYKLTEVNEKVVESLKELSTLVAKLASGGQVNLKKLDAAIEEAQKENQEVASIFPPGCTTGKP